VDNLPTVPPEKYDKLTSILSKIFTGTGHIREGGLFHPVDESTKMSKGYAFVEYENAEQARAAQVRLKAQTRACLTFGCALLGEWPGGRYGCGSDTHWGRCLQKPCSATAMQSGAGSHWPHACPGVLWLHTFCHSIASRTAFVCPHAGPSAGSHLLPLPRDSYPQAALNGYQLDKNHKFAATLFDEADRIAKVPEEYAEPEERKYAPAENLLVSIAAGSWRGM
jgi:hypothetical protein